MITWLRNWRVWVGVGILLLASIFGASIWLLYDLPALSELEKNLLAPSVRILDRNGQLLYDVLPEQGGRHTVLALEQISPCLQKATIATEDKNFYQNPGVDLLGILRALWINLRGGETLAGGSTITQQVARNLLLTDEVAERTLRRKLRESILAWKMARSLSKEDILALYLNQMNYGGMAYGVEAAAQTYFGKPASQLDLAECAFLAGLPQAPGLYNPFVNFDAAKDRQIVVLGLMEEQGYIDPDEKILAEKEKLVLTSAPYPIEAPHFVFMVLAELDQLVNSADVAEYGGLIVRTTLDLDWQLQAERAIRKQLQDLSEDVIDHNVNNAALVAIDPGTGEVLTLVGSANYFNTDIDGAVNMALAPRQPGSALKPIVYAAALDPTQSNYWTAATMILDVITIFQTQDRKSYIPKNYDGLEHGPVSVREALAQSLNIPAVITLDHVGIHFVLDLAEKMGITTFGNPQDYDLSLALGGGAVSLLELSSAYSVFANGGERQTPQFILEIRTPRGERIYTAPSPERTNVLDARVAWLISDILSDNDARMPQFGENSTLRIGRQAAVKTGTTTNFHDNWTIGYTTEIVVGVWVGNSDHEPMREVTGLTGAAPIWHQFIRAILSGTPETKFIQPPDLERVEVCALSGLLPGEICPYRRHEWFIQGTQPQEVDTIYRLVVVDDATGLLANENTPAERQLTRVALDLPPQAHPWAREQGLLLYSDVLTASQPLAGGSTSTELWLARPGDLSVYRIDRGLDTTSQRIQVEAVSNQVFESVTLWIDSEMLASFFEPPYVAWWELVAGTHTAWAEGLTTEGDRVESQRIQFEVIDSQE
jgi:penicillin-binding protein 1C